MVDRIKKCTAAGLLVLTAGCRAPAAPATNPAVSTMPGTQPALTFHNPIKANGADPWMAYVDGWYYLSATNSRDIRLRRAKHLSELASAKDEVVWTDATPGRDHWMWAPEFHRLDDGNGKCRWYCYYTAADREHEPSHRMFVLESTTDDIRGPYAFKAQLKTDPADKYYAIDGTVFEANGQHYFAWCGRPSETGQGLFLSKMANPWTLQGDRVGLKADGFGCPVVREGPEALKHDGKVFLIYSMCGADTPDYRLGMLVADENADLTDPKSWRQYPKVVFARNDAAKVYGPGHNFFFKSPDGKQDWIVYHAKTTTRPTYGDRATWSQPFTWNADGTPNFCEPVAAGVELAEPSGE